MTIQNCSTQRRTQETPGEKADMLAAIGYAVHRVGGGIYLVTRPDGSRTYHVDAVDRHCNCQATACCKHLLFVDWFYDRDRAVADLAEARRRGVLVAECESAMWAAEWHLRRIVGAERIRVAA